MNAAFGEYATSTAFSISLSKNQCNCLLRTDDGRDQWLVSVGSLRGLESRGLVFWNRDDEGNARSFGGLTEAGKLMVGLLKQAGMTIESTNSLSVLRRLERAA